MGMLEGLACKTAYALQEGADYTPVTRTLRNNLVAQHPWSLFSRSENTVGTVATELESLNAVGIIGSQDGRGQMVAMNHQRQGGAWCL